MGLLFTTEGTRRIINTLNSAFDESDDGLKYIRRLVTCTDTLYNATLYTLISSRGWEPAQLAEMLDLMPYDQGSGDGDDGNGPTPHDPAKPIKEKARKRWKHFLTNMIGDKNPAVDGKTPYNTVFAPLRVALADAILNKDINNTALNIVRVSFDHVELDGNQVGDLYAPPSMVIFDAALPDDNGVTTGRTVRHVTLFTVRVPQHHPGHATPFGAATITGNKWKKP
jgi:hypothetical protein